MRYLINVVVVVVVVVSVFTDGVACGGREVDVIVNEYICGVDVIDEVVASVLRTRSSSRAHKDPKFSGQPTPATELSGRMWFELGKFGINAVVVR